LSAILSKVFQEYRRLAIRRSVAKAGNDRLRPALRPPESRRSRRAMYFTELTLENSRCFGPRQTLKLTDAAGRPAMWTVILGENGTGKTTLLQALVKNKFNASIFSLSGLDSLKNNNNYDKEKIVFIDKALPIIKSNLVKIISSKDIANSLIYKFTKINSEYRKYSNSVIYKDGDGKRYGITFLAGEGKEFLGGPLRKPLIYFLFPQTQRAWWPTALSVDQLQMKQM
jgi:hypothetical protein